MYGVGVGCAGGRNECLDVEVVVDLRQPHPGVGFGDVGGGGIGIGVDGDGAAAQPPTGGEHPPGDLAAVGHQNAGACHLHHRFVSRESPVFSLGRNGCRRATVGFAA
jgi:hypothetical protein